MRAESIIKWGDEGEVTYMEKNEEKLMTHLKFTKKFLHIKIHNKESGLHWTRYCQRLISKASQTNNLLNIMC